MTPADDGCPSTVVKRGKMREEGVGEEGGWVEWSVQTQVARQQGFSMIALRFSWFMIFSDFTKNPFRL